MPLANPSALRGVLEALLTLAPSETGRYAIFIHAKGRTDELRAEWLNAFVLLNQQRNRLIRDCPHAVILMGPTWLSELAQTKAPDIWSVRSHVFILPDASELASLANVPQFLSEPFSHELESGEYYHDLADTLRGSGRKSDIRSRLALLRRSAEAWRLRGDLDRSMTCLRNEALPLAAELGEEWEKAEVFDLIGDLVFARGELDEALRIRREEQLPVYERLGDVRARAVALGKIADVLFARGELDEALRIRREEELPVYERLGDVRARAVALGKIADVLFARGELDEALRIRREEQLPVYERLGDVRSRAVTLGKIADVLFARG